jgi:hypothetical protein
MATKETSSKKTRKPTPAGKRRAIKTAKKGSRSRARTNSPRQSISARRAAAPERPEADIQHEVEIDEARERLGEAPEAFSLQTPEGTDSLAEQLGEEFVENVTGADDAASENRDSDTPEDLGGPFIYTTGATEFGSGTDAKREALPRVSSTPS